MDTGYRVEHDSMGEMLVPADALWGAQTQRSLENFPIGSETQPDGIIAAFALLNSTAKATLKKGTTTVAQGTLSLNGKTVTATFSAFTMIT